MIKLLLLLCTFSTVYPQEIHFTFPDHQSRFLHHISRSLKKSTAILIVTPTYRYNELNKKLLSSTKRGSHLHLLVQDPQGDPLSLVQYKGIDLYIAPVPILQTLLLIDNALVCTSTKTLDDEVLSENRATLVCSDDQKKIRLLREGYYPLLKNSKLYLE
jgi:hypothetical protein